MRMAPPPNPNQRPRTGGGFNPGRFSPYAQTPGVDYPYTKPDSNLYPGDWNDVNLIYEFNILRANQNFGRVSGGVSDSDDGYGPSLSTPAAAELCSSKTSPIRI